MSKRKLPKCNHEACAQTRKIAALLDDVGVPKGVMFDEEPGKVRTDLPARVEFALLALADPKSVRVVR